MYSLIVNSVEVGEYEELEDAEYKANEYYKEDYVDIIDDDGDDVEWDDYRSSRPEGPMCLVYQLSDTKYDKFRGRSYFETCREQMGDKWARNLKKYRNTRQ